MSVIMSSEAQFDLSSLHSITDKYIYMFGASMNALVLGKTYDCLSWRIVVSRMLSSFVHSISCNRFLPLLVVSPLVANGESDTD